MPVWFGPYKLLERIAVGGMAEVFRAVRPGLEGFEKTLAIKRIRPHLSDEATFVKMFFNEAKLASQLQHPNVVQIFDLGRIGASYYIAMEYISGRDMSRVIPKADEKGIPFPLEYTLLIAASVLDGLSYAHEKTDDFGVPLNIVHRDVTPENIMVGWNGSVKILDFGIAKATIQAADQTKAGEIKGKLSYMSPEQGMGKVLDARSDVFSLGVVLYEWITGYKLFTGENEMAILKSIIDGRIYPPSYFREDIPEDVQDILMRALEKDRDKRYQSAREMQWDVQRWLHSSEFSPTAGHLSNFIKQLFAEEIEREREALAQAAQERGRKTPPPLPPATGSHDAQVGEAVGHAKTPANGGSDNGPALIVVDSSSGMASPHQPPNGAHNLMIRLDAGEYQRLCDAASRAGVPVEEIVQDLIRSTAKYL